MCFKGLNFVTKFKFLKIREIFFLFVLNCKQKEHVHNLNRRWRPKSLGNLNFQILEMFQQLFKNPRIFKRKFGKLSVSLSPRWRLTLFFPRRVQTYFRMMKSNGHITEKTRKLCVQALIIVYS